MRYNIPHYAYIIFCCLLLSISTWAKAEHSDVLSRTIHLPKCKKTVYQLLTIISDRTGYLFIYDSKLVDNERIVRLKDGSRTVRQAIYEIIGNKQLKLRTTDNHILIYLPSPEPVSTRLEVKTDSISYFALEGTLQDKYSKEPVPYATVTVSGTSIGSITNQTGAFRLNLPDSLMQSKIRFSHLGYITQKIETAALANSNINITLEPKVIPLQEVIIRIVNPVRLLRDMLECREKNYAPHPVYLTSFYREGIEHKNNFVNLTEAVFKIYKNAYQEQLSTDQVKLLKMRTISNSQQKDTLIAKMKSGLDACLSLDIIKSTPDFLSPDNKENGYTYASSDITVIDNRVANVISFEQREWVKDPLYRGELYIDSENNALLGTRFEIQPKYINKAAYMFVEKKSRNMNITPQKVIYSVSYKPWNQTYYINHIRGDLYFKVKKKKLLSGSSTLHVWFEMVTCKIDTQQVKRFTRTEKLPTRTIFAETNFGYDPDFWENFNIILPEEELSKAIEKISSKIEETGY